MRKAALVLVSVLALSVTLVAVAQATATQGVVTIIVRDSSGKPLSNCVVFISVTTGPFQEKRTDYFDANKGGIAIWNPINDWPTGSGYTYLVWVSPQGGELFQLDATFHLRSVDHNRYVATVRAEYTPPS